MPLTDARHAAFIGTLPRTDWSGSATVTTRPTHMVVLRATRKVLAGLPEASAAPGPSDTALGDWYVNRVPVDRRPLLLLVSASSLLPIVVFARDVRRLPDRLADMVAARLTRMGVAPRTVALETRAMTPIVVGRTADRSVVGIMVDFALCLPFYLDPGWNERTLPSVEDKLAQTPCHASRPFAQVVFPIARRPSCGARSGRRTEPASRR